MIWYDPNLEVGELIWEDTLVVELSVGKRQSQPSTRDTSLSSTSSYGQYGPAIHLPRLYSLYLFLTRSKHHLRPFDLCRPIDRLHERRQCVCGRLSSLWTGQGSGECRWPKHGRLRYRWKQRNGLQLYVLTRGVFHLLPKNLKAKLLHVNTAISQRSTTLARAATPVWAISPSSRRYAPTTPT